jgi:hypothetical protein
MNALIHDDIYAWDGFGGRYQLAAGKCRLRIFDLSRARERKLTLLKPHVVVVSDLPDDSPPFRKVSVRSCCSHIATCVARDFKIDPQRMVFVEYYPASTYGVQSENTIPAKLEMVEFQWHEEKALHPKWRQLAPALSATLSGLIEQTDP